MAKLNSSRLILQKLLFAFAIIVHHFISVSDVAFAARLAFSIGLLIAIVLLLKEVIPVLLVFLFMATSRFYFPSALSGLPSLPFLIPFLLTMLFLLPFSSMRSQLDWIRKGHMDQWTCFWVLVTGMSATLALITWGFWTDNLGGAVLMIRGFLDQPTWLILFVVVPIFALVNALAEEVVYRGIVQSSLEKIFGQWHWATHLLQASAFAVVHVAGGFPNGKMGYLMVFVYGLMLGYLKTRSKGMLAPFLTHVLADLTIGYFLFYQALYNPNI